MDSIVRTDHLRLIMSYSEIFASHILSDIDAVMIPAFGGGGVGRFRNISVFSHRDGDDSRFPIIIP